ncbi:MAG TPA: sugar phosphate isomerase/epimerase [Candidatus Saccharimonadales bacterium]|nr:sugar phosphate isomerase/epimerase [Candidatus Saccharimonadales bacterium]
MTFYYSITLSSFLRLREDFETTLKNLNQIGFSNLEMFGEPDDIDLIYFKDLFSNYESRVIGITGMWGRSSSKGWKRRLLSRDPALVKYSENYILNCIKLCNYFGGNKFNVCLFSDSINHIDVTHTTVLEEEKIKLVKKSVPILKKLSRIASDNNIDLVIEPLNRYSTPYCSKFEEAKVLLDTCPDLQVMLDTFHMNIEEDSFSDTIIKAKDRLVHLHFADNNRKMPGEGHIDFKTVIESLKRVSFNGFLSFEPTISSTDYIKKIKLGLEYIKNLDLK